MTPPRRWQRRRQKDVGCTVAGDIAVAVPRDAGVVPVAVVVVVGGDGGGVAGGCDAVAGVDTAGDRSWNISACDFNGIRLMMRL